VRFPRFSVAATTVALLSMPMLVSASCCTTGGNGVQMASAGLGERQPVAINLSLDPAWFVYAFQRDGVTYYQVNDPSGQVVLIIANIDSTFWTLPAGNSSVRVSLPSQRLAMPATARRHLVFQASDFSLAVHGEGKGAIWSVETSPSEK